MVINPDVVAANFAPASMFIDPDVVAAIFVPSSAAFVIALCFRQIREAVAARLRGGSHDAEEVELAILSEVRTLRNEVYALRSEVAEARLGRPESPPHLPPGDRPASGTGVR